MRDTWWPLAALAAIQLIDGIVSLKPLPFVADCLEGVQFPRRHWWMLPPIKFAATAGLVTGIWLEPLAVLTTAALVTYFVVALVMHLRARDFRRYLYVNCLGMLAVSSVILVWLLAA
jgi:hypothetical protein